MVAGVVTIEPSDTLLTAAQLMRDTNVGVLPIVEYGQLRGLITDRDLVVRAMARGVDPEATPVRYFESDELAAAEPQWDVEEDALEVRRRQQVGRLPVVDATGRLVGIVTLSSLALRSRRDEAAQTAKQVAQRSARGDVGLQRKFMPRLAVPIRPVRRWFGLTVAGREGPADAGSDA